MFNHICTCLLTYMVCYWVKLMNGYNCYKICLVVDQWCMSISGIHHEWCYQSRQGLNPWCTHELSFTSLRISSTSMCVPRAENFFVCIASLPFWWQCPSSLLYNGYRVFFPGIKLTERDVNHPPTPSNTEVQEIADLYLSPRHLRGWNFDGRTDVLFELTVRNLWRQLFLQSNITTILRIFNVYLVSVA